MKIGAKLKVKRDTKRLSQQEIATFLNVSQRTYSNIESDKSEPSLTQLHKLAEILDFNLLELLQEQGFTFNQTNNQFKDNSSGIVFQNTTSEKLIAQYDARVLELQEIIALLKEKISK